MVRPTLALLRCRKGGTGQWQQVAHSVAFLKGTGRAGGGGESEAITGKQSWMGRRPALEESDRL